MAMWALGKMPEEINRNRLTAALEAGEYADQIAEADMVGMAWQIGISMGGLLGRDLTELFEVADWQEDPTWFQWINRRVRGVPVPAEVQLMVYGPQDATALVYQWLFQHTVMRWSHEEDTTMRYILANHETLLRQVMERDQVEFPGLYPYLPAPWA
jgi:hypothetical protein